MTYSPLRRAFTVTVTAAAVALAGAVALPAAAKPVATKKPVAKRRPAAKKKPAAKKRQAAAERGALLHGAGVPRRATGELGDFYLRTSNRTLYGPKTRRGWGIPTSLVGATGPQGAPGLAGPTGAAGATGAAGTPAFAAAAVTVLPAPTVLSATSDANGDVYAPNVPVATVTLPAGLSFVMLRAQAVRRGTWPANGDESWISCGIPVVAPNLAELYVSEGTTATGFAWVWNTAATTTQLQCALGSYFPDGTAGVTLSADLAGTELAVVPVSVPTL